MHSRAFVRKKIPASANGHQARKSTSQQQWQPGLGRYQLQSVRFGSVVVRVEKCGLSLGVAMVAPQQAYQAASFSASTCAIKIDLPALVACLVRTRTWESAALITSPSLSLPAAHSDRRCCPCRGLPAKRRHRCIINLLAAPQAYKPPQGPEGCNTQGFVQQLSRLCTKLPRSLCSGEAGSTGHRDAKGRVCWHGSFLDSSAWA